GHRLAGAGLADHAHDLALGDIERDIVDRVQEAAPGREVHFEIADGEDRLAHADRLWELPRLIFITIAISGSARRAASRPACSSTGSAARATGRGTRRSTTRRRTGSCCRCGSRCRATAWCRACPSRETTASPR